MNLSIVPRVIFGTYRDDTRLLGLIRFCKRIGADEVMLVPCDVPREPVWLPKDQIGGRIRHTREAVAACKAHSIEASLNVLRVLMPAGHERDPIGFRQGMVSLGGQEDRFAPCPLDEAYRDYMRYFFERLGETGAPRIFVDDDFRYEYVTRGSACFCPLHLAAFNRRTGRTLARDALVLACEDPAPNAVKADWLDFKRTTLLELARLMEQALHRTNPDARLGLMLTSAEIAAFGGRDARELVEAFAGGRRPLARPGMGFYQDYDRLVFLYGLANDTLFYRQRLGDGVDLYAEVDAYPHGPFVKASRICLDYQVKAGLACGLKRQSLWVFTPEEVVDETHPAAAALLRYGKVHQAIAGVVPDSARVRGIGIVRREDMGLVKSQNMRSAEPYPYGASGHGVAPFLWRLGVPITFEEADPLVLTRDSTLIDAGRVEGYVRDHNVLVTLEAARAIGALGLSRLIGVAFERMLEGPEFRFEQFTDHSLNGRYAGREFQARAKQVGKLVPATEPAAVLSSFTAADGTVTAPGIVLTEQGGRRAAVLPYDLEDRYYLPTLRLKEQLRNVLEWLSGKPLPAFLDGAADVFPIVLEEEATGRRVVSVLNASHDPAEECDLWLAPPAAGAWSLAYVSDAGRVEAIPASACRHERGCVGVRLAGDLAVPPFDVRVVVLKPEDASCAAHTD